MNTLVILLCVWFPNNFQKIFGMDYDNAVKKITKHKNEISFFSSYYKTDTSVIASTIFPEMIRYSSFSDFIETKALEMLYTDFGKEAADFSIGDYQMKPSFAENIEFEVESEAKLKQKYQVLNGFKDTALRVKRMERLMRLQNTNWQMIYVNAFFDIVSLKTENIHWKNQTEKIRFFATAYNSNFKQSISYIENQYTHCNFPYGQKYNGKQYNYADVSIYFYANTFQNIFTN